MLYILIFFSPLILLGFILIEYLISAILYEKSNYYKITHKKYHKVRFNKGFLGEYMIYKNLLQYEKKGARFLYNCYLPKDNNGTTEIDVIMIYRSGIYVFESKNYGGWIFGSETGRTWTQVLPNGRESRKEHFLNPIIQNKLHIKCLKTLIGAEYPIHSMIVFSDRCTFKDVDLNTKEATIIYRRQVKNVVAGIDNNASGYLSESQIEGIYAKLYPFTQVSEDVKNKHIEDIRSAVAINDNKTSSSINNEKCPKCGGTLVLRTAKQGIHAGEQFWGCSNYPKCRYIRNEQKP